MENILETDCRENPISIVLSSSMSVVWKYSRNKTGSILWKSSSLFQISDARYLTDCRHTTFHLKFTLAILISQTKC